MTNTTTLHFYIILLLKRILKFQIYFLTEEEGGRAKPFTNTFQIQMFCKTWDVPALMKLSEGKDLIMPGEDASVIFTILKDMVRVQAL